MNIDNLDLTGNSAPTLNVDAKPTTENEVLDDKTNLTSGDDSTESIATSNPTNQTNPDSNPSPKEEKEKDESNSSTGGLSQGDQVELDGKTYTVSDKGELLDDKGSVVKTAEEVNKLLEENNVEDKAEIDNREIDIQSLQEALGVTVTNASGDAVEFTNDIAGVKSYVDSVLELKTQEVQQAAINKLFIDNPLLKQFNDYVTINGTASGFGNIPDRSGIVIDKDNKMQQAAIIRMAAQEFGNKSFNENYIKYLADSGNLYDEAKAQLQALVDKDIEYRKQIEQQAEQQRKQEQINVQNYWNNVKSVIDKRQLGNYKIPEHFTKQVNGQKVSFTPDDFFDYLSKPKVINQQGNTITEYQKDLEGLTNEEYLNRELLDAWLMFTGGSYKDLVDMAIKEDKVRQLKITAKEQRKSSSIKVIKKPSNKVTIDNIVF